MPTEVLQASQGGSTAAGASPLVAEARRVVLDSLDQTRIALHHVQLPG